MTINIVHFYYKYQLKIAIICVFIAIINSKGRSCVVLLWKLVLLGENLRILNIKTNKCVTLLTIHKYVCTYLYIIYFINVHVILCLSLVTTVSFNQSTYIVNEIDLYLQITLVLSNVSSVDVTVQVTNEDITASEYSSYVLI